MPQLVVRSMSTADSRPGREIEPYHCYLKPPGQRHRAWWTAYPSEAQVFGSLDEAGKEIARLWPDDAIRRRPQIAPLNAEEIAFPSFWERHQINVPAVISSDNGVVHQEFNLAPWLREATGDAILDMAAMHWGGSFPKMVQDLAMQSAASDEMAGAQAAIRTVMDHAGSDYWIQIDGKAAVKWLSANNPVDLEKICEAFAGHEDALRNIPGDILAALSIFQDQGQKIVHRPTGSPVP